MANIIKESLLQLHSPSAAELGRYGKAPVDYFTGVPLRGSSYIMWLVTAKVELLFFIICQ